MVPAGDATEFLAVQRYECAGELGVHAGRGHHKAVCPGSFIELMVKGDVEVLGIVARSFSGLVIVLGDREKVQLTGDSGKLVCLRGRAGSIAISSVAVQ